MVKQIEIILDEDIGFYTILINGEITYECCGRDEVVEIVNELMGGN